MVSENSYVTSPTNDSASADTRTGTLNGAVFATTRRGFITKAFAAGIGLTAVGSGALKLVRFRDEMHLAATPQKRVQGNWVLVMDLRTCDGCKSCTRACQKGHYLAPDQEWIKVYSMKATTGETYFMPRTCMQCEDSPCLRVCPVGASFRADDGVILVDQNRCIGCRMCMAACPYEARYFNWSDPPKVPRLPMASGPTPENPVPQQKGTVGKCTFCSDRIHQGQLPHCVEECPMGVLYIGDRNTDVAVNGLGTAVKLSQFLADNDAVRFKDELNTHPRVYYILGHGQELKGM